MRVAAVQFDCQPGDPAANQKILEELVRRASERGATLIVFPEMADTGYDMSRVADSAGTWDGPFITDLRSLAEELGATLIGGVSEVSGDHTFNAVVAINSRGEIVGRYRKTHLFEPAGEHAVLSAGRDPVVVNISEATVGISVCYDLRFPELFRVEVDAGATVLAVASAFPFPRLGHWQVLTRARAIDNQVFVVAANRIGSDGPLTFCGNSCVIDPSGCVIACLGETTPGVADAEIELGEVERVRRSITSLSDRRPDVYSRPASSGLNSAAEVAVRGEL